MKDKYNSFSAYSGHLHTKAISDNIQHLTTLRLSQTTFNTHLYTNAISDNMQHPPTHQSGLGPNMVNKETKCRRLSVLKRVCRVWSSPCGSVHQIPVVFMTVRTSLPWYNVDNVLQIHYHCTNYIIDIIYIYI